MAAKSVVESPHKGGTVTVVLCSDILGSSPSATEMHLSKQIGKG